MDRLNMLCALGLGLGLGLGQLLWRVIRDEPARLDPLNVLRGFREEIITGF